MAGDWIKWTKGLAAKKEIMGIAARLSVKPSHAAGLCMVFWEWLDDNVASAEIDENGNAHVTLGALQASFIDAIVHADGFAAALTAEGWLNARNGSLTVPNYARHNGQTAKDRALTNERVSKSRLQKCNGSSVTKSLPEKRREENIDTKGEAPPLPFNSPQFSSAWNDWLAYRRERKLAVWKPRTITAKFAEFTQWGEESSIAAIRRAIANGHQGIFEPRGSFQQQKPISERNYGKGL